MTTSITAAGTTIFISGDQSDTVRPITSGGTGADNAADARTNLGLGLSALADILGTVSQSGGVPTGALMEEGNDSNGYYLRLASGFQVCWHELTSSSSAAATWTFPKAFIANPECVVQPRVSGFVNNGTWESRSTTNMTFSCLNTSAVRQTTVCGLFAIGRWF